MTRMRRIFPIGVIAFIVACASIEAIGLEDVAELYKKGFELQHAGKLEQALAIYDRCLEQDPTNYKALFASATVYYAMGDYAKALARFEKLLSFYPDQGRIPLYVAYCRLHLGKVAEAKAALDRIVVNRPKDVAAIIGLGWAEYLSGNRFTAISYFKKALALQPGNKVLAGTVSRLESTDEEYLKERKAAEEQRLTSELDNAIAEVSLVRARARASRAALSVPEDRSAVEKMALLDLMQVTEEPKKKVRPFPFVPHR
jgi:tetratricopeptide (TPR) repeat protein